MVVLLNQREYNILPASPLLAKMAEMLFSVPEVFLFSISVPIELQRPPLWLPLSPAAGPSVLAVSWQHLPGTAPVMATQRGLIGWLRRLAGGGGYLMVSWNCAGGRRPPPAVAALASRGV